uniref:Uncharacterized protein n=1 Tax=Amphora coffeiformis TaxID=265554 RepID=A0A7S3L7Y2_9STRA|mmetsp:Transcript_12730/g.24200  ORF Transcript_12730/g.24200 Transcript_12730/m.24200 type:complete len:247 (-) Transcript_12730:375-1115(-)
MTIALHGTYAALHLAVSLWNCDLYFQRKQLKDNRLMLGLLFNSISLVYDNLVLATGCYIPFSVLETLSIGRFVLHACVTPTMILAGLYIANHSKLPWAMSPIMHRAMTLTVAVLTTMGIHEHLLDYEAYPVCLQNGIVHYTQGNISPDLYCAGISYPFREVAGRAPQATVATIVILTFIGMDVAFARGNAWLLLGCIFMIITAAVTGAIGHNTMGWLCNGGEVGLIASMALAMRHEPTLKAVPTDI